MSGSLDSGDFSLLKKTFSLLSGMLFSQQDHT